MAGLTLSLVQVLRAVGPLPSHTKKVRGNGRTRIQVWPSFLLQEPVPSQVTTEKSKHSDRGMSTYMKQFYEGIASDVHRSERRGIPPLQQEVGTKYSLRTLRPSQIGDKIKHLQKCAAGLIFSLAQVSRGV